MFRLKDFMSMMVMNNGERNIVIYNHNNYEINYDDISDYINKIVYSIGFRKNGFKNDCDCIIKLLNEDGDNSYFRHFITYKDIEECIDSNVLIPIDYKTKNGIWEFEDKYVVGLNPSINNNFLTVDVMLSNNVMQIITPNTN